MRDHAVAESPDTRLLNLYVSGSDARLVIFVQDGADLGPLRDRIADRYHLPHGAILLAPIEGPPLLSSGKVDYKALARAAEALKPDVQESGISTRSLLQQALRMPVLDLDRSFLELGGDSLAYLEVQMHLLTELGTVPDDWEHLPLRELMVHRRAALSALTPVRPAVQPVRADLLARVVAILAVIALHSTALPTGGGSYLLLILVGYSLARFQSGVLFEGNVLRTWRSMLVPILVCYYLLIGLIALLWYPVGAHWFMLTANFEHAVPAKGLRPYWFVSTYAQIILLFTLPFLVAPLRRRIGNRPLVAGLLALTGVVLATHLSAVLEIPSQIRQQHPLGAIELLLLGWCICFVRDLRQKVLVTLVTLFVWWFGWSDADRSTDILMLGGTMAMIWGLSVHLPVWLARGLMHVGSLTLFLYIVHAPVISIVGHLRIHSNVISFVIVTLISLVAAASFKAGYDWIDGRLSVGRTRMSAAVRN